MSSKYNMNEKDITIKELKEDKINFHLSLRKKEYNKRINNKRKILSGINSLIKNTSNSSQSPNILLENNIFKVLSNEQILEKINQLKNNLNIFINNELTEINQCFFSLEFHMNQNLLNSINFIEDNKIDIFIIDFIEKVFNSSFEKDINNISNDVEILVSKVLQLLFKYSSNKDHNFQMINYLMCDNRIEIFNKIISSLTNKPNNNYKKIIINDDKKTNILLFIIIILHNLSIESSDLFNLIQNIKFNEKLIALLNNKNNNIYINDKNIEYFILYFSLNLLDENVKNKEENYIVEICEFFNKKGIISSNLKAQDLSLRCLCNITAFSESKKLYNKMIYSGIFDNIFHIISTSKKIHSITVSLKIVNNILDEESIDLNFFINSNLLKGLMNLVINYEINKKNLTPDLLHHIFSIFLYLTKSPLFYSLINNNLKFIDVLVELIGKISNCVTHDILTFIQNIIKESYKISQIIIYNNEELIKKLIYLIKEDCHHNEIPIMSAIILVRIMNFYYNNKQSNDSIFQYYEEQLKEIIEIKLINEKTINKKLKKVLEIILNIMN